MPANTLKRLLITPGEPAGIGPDILLNAIQQNWSVEIVAVCDPNLLVQRAAQLNLPLTYHLTDLTTPPTPAVSGELKIYPVSLATPVTPGKLRRENVHYVLETLSIASKACLNNPKTHALVTGPVHKGILNEAGIPFTGHTEFLAKISRCKKTVMLFVVDQLKVALATTHLPLKDVTTAITKDNLLATLEVLRTALITRFNILNPRIGVSGVNPHAGENGYLGREEIDIITPLLDSLREKNWQIAGPLPADTLFTPNKLAQFDAILAMYHDQALPVVKYLGFDRAVNVTLGLPFIRTSVDHGTALEVAGTMNANPGSLIEAMKLAAILLK